MTTSSPNRALLVLIVVLLALASNAVGRLLVGSAAPIYAPAENPAAATPAVGNSLAPLPAAETVMPAAPSVRPVTPTAGPPATALARPTVPAGPATSAAPGRDIPAVAPELGVPGFTPPPGRE